MKTRIITGVVLAAVFLLLMWLDLFFINFIVFGVIFLISFNESLRLYDIKSTNPLFVAFVLFVAFGAFKAQSFADLSKFIFLYISVICGYMAYRKSDYLKLILPFLYPCVPLFLLFGVYTVLGNIFLVWLIAIVVFCDSGAYFIGKFFGKHKFTQTSPNKTIEGVLGGLACGVLAGIIYGKFFTYFDLRFLAQLSFLIALFGIFGDLFESYLKRAARLKDSGSIFPGHGGMLDRLDGYLFGAVAMLAMCAL